MMITDIMKAENIPSEPADHLFHNLKTLISKSKAGTFFSPALIVSEASKFSDSIWSWKNHTSRRLSAYSSGDDIIDWQGLRAELSLSEKIIDQLKMYAFLRISCSAIVFPRTRRVAHPIMVLREVKSCARFLAHLCNQMSVADQSLIISLNDIRVQDIKNGIDTYPLDSSLFGKVLRNLGSEFFSMFCGIEPLQWNSQDILTMINKKPSSVQFERLPERLFSLISNEATMDIKQFLKSLGIEAEDTSSIVRKGKTFLEPFSNFRDVFEEYVKHRTLARRSKPDWRNYVHWTQKISATKKSVRDLSNLVDRARKAAQMIIMLYTGARISEFVGFRIGCLRRKNDHWVIAGTVIKWKDISAATEQDEWIAIPIVRDAIKVLEQTARITNAKYLFHDCRYQADDDFRQMSSSEVSYRIRRYISLIDKRGEWKDFMAHAHQFRYSLVYEMRKVGLGLPFITHQLKHSYRAFDYSINNITLSYASAKGGAVQSALDDASALAVRRLYQPDALLAGGGAEAHKRRSMAYFQGMALQGFTVDEILRLLVNQDGMPLTDVGLGYCQGQSKITVDGVKTDPPCIGQLQCSPVRCQNAVIPEHKLSAWEKVAEENLRRADDPEFAHVKNHLLKAAEEAKSVIQFFQIERRNKNDQSSI